MRIYLNVFLTSAIGEDECSGSRPDRFTLPGTHRQGAVWAPEPVWTVQRAVGEQKNLLHISAIKPWFLGCPARSPSGIPTEL
jgi:hypothetical protein